MKPKPLSIRHRFILLQAAAFALAVWLLAGAVYINWQIRHQMEGPLRDLHEATGLNAEIEVAQQQVMVALGEAYFRPGEESRRAFQAAARKLPELAARYARTPLSWEEHRALMILQQLQALLLERASQNIYHQEGARPTVTHLWEAQKVNLQIVYVLHTIDQAHLQRLQDSTARLRIYTRVLYLLLAAFGLFAVFGLLQFRRIHQREIWRPLEELRRMVIEIRQGNLDVSSGVPRSVEFGPLVSGFLDMARELRGMRDSLEQRVQERTAKLEATQRELVQAAKLSSLGQLVSGVAHEINNPLTSILGFSELALARPGLDSRVRAQLQTIRDEAVRLKTLVANLSTFARRAPQRSARMDLRTVLDRLVQLRRYQLAVSNIELHYEHPTQPVWVVGDQDLLLQVFFNLVLNAEQALQPCRNGGDIWIACGAEDGRAWARVRDNGAGMSPEIQERIFDPFFTTKPVGQGTGLGLSISHGIIQQHYGTITVESVEGQGTTVRITFPVDDQAKAPASEPAPKPALAPAPENRDAAHRRRALIIDDEPAVSGLLEQFLESRGWKHVVLNDPTATEATLDGQPFDLVICDLKMPGRNGLDILRLLRLKRPQLARRFLLMTGNVADAGEKDIDELAGVPILRKPFTLARLAEALSAMRLGQK